MSAFPVKQDDAERARLARVANMRAAAIKGAAQRKRQRAARAIGDALDAPPAPTQPPIGTSIREILDRLKAAGIA